MNHIEARKHLIALLTEPYAHVSFEQAIKNYPEQLYGQKLGQFPHTPWELLEHLRICQWDILEFSRDPDHLSPEFPKGYWPSDSAPPDDHAWDKSCARFIRDLNEFMALIEDESNDLLKPFAYGDGQTLFREACVLAKHNSYHIGQLMAIKKGA